MQYNQLFNNTSNAYPLLLEEIDPSLNRIMDSNLLAIPKDKHSWNGLNLLPLSKVNDINVNVEALRVS